MKKILRDDLRLIDVINIREDIEHVLGVNAKAYGCYSVESSAFIKHIKETNHKQDAFYKTPYRLIYKEPFSDMSKCSILKYLLAHNGKVYFPARQKGCRNGYMIVYDISRLDMSSIVESGDYLYIEEPSGQLAFDF